MAELAEATTTDTMAAESSKRSTADAILEGAFRILARDGYESLTARKVAQEAGTNLALVNYYFGGKKGLLLALYDRLEHGRYERQVALYADDGEPLSGKWRRAVEYYRQDLQDGFVRVHHELQARGYADAELAERGRRRVASWGGLLTDVCRRYLPTLGIDHAPEQVAYAFSAFWYGMEQLHLIGLDEAQAPYFEMLGRIGDYLEGLERAAAVPSGRASEG